MVTTVVEQATPFDQLADGAISALGQFLTNDEPDRNAIASARIASSILSAWTRHRQTEGAREATLFMMARELAGDKEELKKFMVVAAPSSPLVKALPKGK